MMSNEKVTLSTITDILCKTLSVPRKTAESVSKAFNETIIEALNADGQITIDGLGTFKIVDVSERESVSITNGERIVIAGYKKVGFTPDDSVVDMMNQRPTDENYSHTAEEAKPIGEDTETVVNAEEKPEKVDQDYEALRGKTEQDDEALQDEDIYVDESSVAPLPDSTADFIDCIIDTPESINDIRQELQKAENELQTAIRAAREAKLKTLKYKKMLSQMESHEAIVMPTTSFPSEAISTHIEDNSNNIAHIPTIEDDTVSQTPSDSEATLTTEQALDRYLKDEGEHYEKDDVELALEKAKRRKVKKFMTYTSITMVAIIVLFVIGFAGGRYLRYRSHQQAISATAVTPSKSAPPHEAKQTVTDVDSSKNETVTITDANRGEQIDTLVKHEMSREETKRPKIHVLAKGDNLNRISMKYYGTKDSVNAIIRANDFANPNNIPIGATIKLP